MLPKYGIFRNFPKFASKVKKKKKKLASFSDFRSVKTTKKPSLTHNYTHTDASLSHFSEAEAPGLEGVGCHGRTIHHQRRAVEGASVSERASARGCISIRPPSLNPGNEEGGGTNSDCVR